MRAPKNALGQRAQGQCVHRDTQYVQPEPQAVCFVSSSRCRRAAPGQQGSYYEPSKLRGQPMARMNWRRAQLYGRRTLDHRYENDVPDAAERWLRRAEHRQQRRITVIASSSVISSSNPRGNPRGLVGPHSFSSTVVRPPGKRNPT